MQHIGEVFKEARENMKLAVTEVAEDLKVSPNQVELVEAGDRHAFQDIFDLKDFIRTYAKYLGLDGDQLIDEFNEYLFDFTSKIPLKAIEIAKKEKAEVKDEIKSPYTLPKNKVEPVLVVGSILLVVVFGILMTYLIIYFLNSDMLSGFIK